MSDHEVAQLRASLTAMHRRAQSAERGLLARLEPGQRTLGRALANSAAVMYRERLRELAAAVCAYIEQHGLEHDDECPEDDTCRCRLVRNIDSALLSAREALR